MLKNNNNNLIFEKEKIQFFPKDVEKMQSMSEEERIEYKRVLKREHRYIVIK